MKRTTQYISCILFFITIITSNLYSQILLKEASLEKQINNSSLVVEGRVLAKKAFWDVENKKIYTTNVVEVYKVFKGLRIDTLEVITEGGTVGLSAQIVTPSLSLSQGDIGVFMLYDNNIRLKDKSAKKQFKTYGSLQGFYKYNVESDEAVNPFNKKKGISTTLYNEIINITKTDFVEIKNVDLTSKQTNSNKGLLVPGAITFTPTSIAGGIKSVLTINGTGFGTSRGVVSFSNSDDGGATFINALATQILTWNNTQITVEVPSRAGTGIIRVTDSGSASATSASNLTVTYSELNVVADDVNPGTDVAYKIQHINDNTSGGYSWQMYTSFDANASAKSAFTRALDTWRCQTGINWVLAATTTINVEARDNINVVRFDVGSELDTDVLGRCTSYYEGCFAPGNTTLNWYVSELDIIFDDATNWNFNSATNSTAIGQYDFESVTLHELGHGHQLAHVNDTNDVMNYAISTSEEQRVLGTRNINSGNAIQNRSRTTTVCGQLSITNHPCFLSVAEEELKEAISIYPNPSKGSFNIKNASLISLEKVTIYDISGRLISEYDMTNASRIKVINLYGASRGLYFVNIQSDSAVITKKVILD